MHRLAISKMKIELPWRSVPPSQAADIGRHVAHAHVLVGHVDARRLFVAGPAAQHVFDARVGVVGVVAGMRVVHRHDVGQHRRPHIVVVVGGDAHELRALDQEGRVADVSETHLVGFERGKLESGRHDGGPRRAIRPGQLCAISGLTPGLGAGAAPCARACTASTAKAAASPSFSTTRPENTACFPRLTFVNRQFATVPAGPPLGGALSAMHGRAAAATGAAGIL